MAIPDVHKILKDLELKAVGLDPATNAMPEGYVTSFRDVGLPIHEDDFANPWSPPDDKFEVDIPMMDPTDLVNAANGGAASGPGAEVTAEVAKSQQAYLNAFMLVDDKLRADNQYSATPWPSKLSDSWRAIVNGARSIPPKTVMSPERQMAYFKAKAKLMDPDGSPARRYQKYMTYETAYRDTLRAWHRAYADAVTDSVKLHAWPIQCSEHSGAANEAWDDWQSFGFKAEIESALQALAAHGEGPAAALIVHARTRYENSITQFRSIGDIPYTMMMPHNWYDPDNDDGWASYTRGDYHSDARYAASSTSYEGNRGISTGFWSVDRSYAHPKDRIPLNISKDLDITFSYCVVDIKRPWLDTSLLNLENWFLEGDYTKGCISDGTATQDEPAEDRELVFLPSILSSLILIKDLNIEWPRASDDLDRIREIYESGGSLGWGPFCVGGHYERYRRVFDFSMTVNGHGLSIGGIQLLGYVSKINPMSPRSDSSDYMRQVDGRRVQAHH